MASLNVTDMAISQTDPNRMYVSCKGQNSGSAFATQDGGLSWVDITPANQRFTAIAASPLDSDVVFLATDGPWDTGASPGVYASADGGATWTNNWTERLRPSALVASPFDASDVGSEDRRPRGCGCAIVGAGSAPARAALWMLIAAIVVALWRFRYSPDHVTAHSFSRSIA